MSLTLRKKVFITAALTGSGGTQNKSLNVPRSPQQISKAAIAAAKAGAAVVHCHVRDPKTGEPARELALYRESCTEPDRWDGWRSGHWSA